MNVFTEDQENQKQHTDSLTLISTSFLLYSPASLFLTGLIFTEFGSNNPTKSLYVKLLQFSFQNLLIS